MLKKTISIIERNKIEKVKKGVLSIFLENADSMGVLVDELEEDIIEKLIIDSITRYFENKDEGLSDYGIEIVKDYVLKSINRDFTNDKFYNAVSLLQKKKKELDKLKKEIEKIQSDVDVMQKERDNLQIYYINLSDILKLVNKYSDVNYSYSTMQQWKDKGLFGEIYKEDELCPNTYTSRAYYFKKDVVLENLIREGKIKLKYNVLDQVDEYVVTGHGISYDNSYIFHYCDNIKTGRTEQIDENYLDYLVKFNKNINN